jgi:hypothetical protein
LALEGNVVSVDHRPRMNSWFLMGLLRDDPQLGWMVNEMILVLIEFQTVCS